MADDAKKTETAKSTAQPQGFNHTITIGERSLGYLKEYRTPAIPRNYEIFYIHSAGYNKELSEAIREAVAKHSCLTEEDAERLYQTYIQPTQYSEQIGNVSTQVSGEITHIMQAITNACQKTGNYGSSLAGITDQLSHVQNPTQLKIVVKKLVLSTSDMIEYNHNLEKRLADSKKQIEELNHNLETIRAESHTDQLTGLSNRKRFDEILRKEMAEAKESHDPLCLMFMDIDRFKKFNDAYGHLTGDQVLRLVSHTLKESIKKGGHAARYGGEEFAVILPNTTLESALSIAEIIRQAIKAKELIKKSTGQSLGFITMSIGIALYKSGELADELISRADTYLYAAKDAGRNCVKYEGNTVAENQPSETETAAA